MIEREDPGQKVPPLTESDIEIKAERFRSIIGLLGPLYIVNLIEFGLPKIFPDFDFAVIEDDSLFPDLARTYPDKLFMDISESIYDGARLQSPHCNYVLAHELGHLVLHRGVIQSFALATEMPKYNSFFSSEWQADTFADYLLMRTEDVMATCESVEDIQKRYLVPEEQAKRRHEKIFGNTQKTEKELKPVTKNEKGQNQLAFRF